MPNPARRFSRRQFLKFLPVLGPALGLTACRLSAPATPTRTRVPPTAPRATPTRRATPIRAAPTATATATPKALVALGQASTYEPQPLRATLEQLLADLGGLSSLVKTGARVGLKVNLTGGTWWDYQYTAPATELFVTHPAVVGALGELLLDAGAGQLLIMDGLGDPASFDKWGYTAMAKPLGAQLIDLCQPAPHASFTTLAVPPPFLIYDQFTLNPSLTELDVFISVAKMKCHGTTGITLALKNLIGLAPTSLYRKSEDQNNRSAFHGSAAFDTRLPSVIIDLNRVRPIQLAVIDGIMTVEAGAGPWNTTMAQVKPGVLLAGRDPVATDAVGTAVMGFDPEAASGQLPFTHGDNHLALASAAGLGTHILAEIEARGAALEAVRYPFKPVE